MNRRAISMHMQGGGTTLAKNHATRVFGAKLKPTMQEYRKLAAVLACQVRIHPKEPHALSK